jgi:hypothetical protein
MTHVTLSRIALAGLIIIAASCADQPTAPLSATQDASLAAGGGTSLAFNGVNANASTPLGTVLTTQIDDIAVDATVRWAGPNAANAHQMIYYNGHGAVTGWGIIVMSVADGAPQDGTIGILAGGIAIPLTPFVLQPGVWHQVQAERRASIVTVTFDDQTYEVGGLGVNPIGGFFAGIERTSIGGDGTFDAPTGNFNGSIDKVRVRDLASGQWLERWNFNAGQGTTATGVNGTVLNIGSATWARRGN